MAEIVEIKTVPLHSQGAEASDPTHAIMVAVNTDAAGAPASFVRDLAKTIALHRLCSPPDTSVLVVSVIGPFEPEGFRAVWCAALSEPAVEMQALCFFLEQMSTAEVVHGRRDGTVLNTVSLKSE